MLTHYRMCSESEALFDLFLQEFILEFLFSEDLSALLSSSNEVGHDLLCRSKRQIFEYFVVFLSEASRHLVGESSQLSKSDSFALSESVLFNEVDCLVASNIVV